jgi:RNA polymerase sigma-B factor
VRVRDRGDTARDALVERYLSLARHRALRLRTPTVPFDDVFQVACLGRLKAVDRFDADRGVAFSTFATPTISGEIKRYFRDGTWSLHISATCRTARCGSSAPAGRLSAANIGA